MFECNMNHKFVLNKKQIVNGKWCLICTKLVLKLQDKVKKENLNVLRFDGSKLDKEELKALFENKLGGLQDYLEEKLMKEHIIEEINERKTLENKFQRWNQSSSESSPNSGTF